MKKLYFITFLGYGLCANAQLCDPNTSSLFFDGNSYVSIGSDNDLNITDDITVEAWIYATAWGPAPNVNSIVCKHGWTAGELGYVLRTGKDGQLSFTIAGIKPNGDNDSWKEVKSPPGRLQLNTWHHVAGTFNGSKLRLYIDGEQVASKNFNGSIAHSGPYDLKIGRIADNGAASGRFFTGMIDEVRVWDRALSESDLDNEKDEHISGNSNGLVGYWRFNELGGQTCDDRSSEDNDGTIHNATWNVEVPFTNGVSRPSISQWGSDLVSSALLGNQWNKNGIPIPGETGITFTPTSGGSYTVTTDFGLGCVATSEPFFITILGIEDESKFTLAYRYVTGGLYFRDIPENLHASVISIYDLNGRVVGSPSVIADFIPLPILSSGVYILSIKNDKQVVNQRFYVN